MKRGPCWAGARRWPGSAWRPAGPLTALTGLRNGRTAGGRQFLTPAGELSLMPDERALVRADFVRAGLLSLHGVHLPPSVMLDLDRPADVTVTDQRVVVVIDRRERRPSRWSADDVPEADPLRSLERTLPHRDESVAIEVPLARIERLLCPSSPLFGWATKDAVDLGWMSDDHESAVMVRMVLRGPPDEPAHVHLARQLANVLGAPRVGDEVDWHRRRPAADGSGRIPRYTAHGSR